MARKSHPFAQPGRPKAVAPPKPVKLPSGEIQGVAPSDGFRSRIPAQTFASGAP